MSIVAPIPRLRLPLPRKGPVPDAALKLACDRFAEAGVLILDDLWPRRYATRLREAFLEAYGERIAEEKARGSKDVGDRRLMLAVDIEGPFNDRRLYANSHVMRMMGHLLGGRMIVGTFNAVTSMPGARIQHLHADHPELFWNRDLDGSLPVYCVTFSVPLVDLDAQTGTTRFYPGSHRQPWQEKPQTPYADPEVPMGSAILFDIRTRHRGLANRSAAPRPVLYATYNRPWFRDYVNYDFDRALRITPAALETVPKKYRHLFAWAVAGQENR